MLRGFVQNAVHTLSSAVNVLGYLETKLRNLFLPFPAHQPCFQWRAVWQAFISLDGHRWGWWFYLSYPHPWWNACSCSEPESGSIRDHTKILKCSEFSVQGKGSAIAQGHTKSHLWHKKHPAVIYVLCASLVNRAGFLLLISLEKIGIWNERWHNVLPRSITVSCLELVDNSWQVIYIALLLILPFISSVVNLLEVLLIRVVFANHMVYLY